MKKKNITLVAMVTVILTAILVFAQVPDAQVENSKLKSILSNKTDPFIYIVQMDLDPVITYKGDIPGLRATKPRKGKKINPKSAHVKKIQKLS